MDTANEAKRFLTTLWPSLDGHWLLLWGAPSKRSEWIASIDDEALAGLPAWAEKENVYVGCALRSQALGPTLRGEKADCSAIPGVWLDIDYGTEHKKPNLPPTEEDAMSLIQAMGPIPSLIVHSGRGLQAWWLFREPWIFDTPDDRGTAESLTKGWCTTLRHHAKARGWDADQVGDLPRVMRIAGTWNRKGVPKRTRIITESPDRYNPDDLRTYLMAGVQEPRTTAQLKWDLVKSPTAEPPSQKFLLLCECDSDFKRLCLRLPRSGQDDLSASGFDFQLARIAFAADWDGQEVCNLLIAQRRTHKADLKLNHPTYYESTLSAAYSVKHEENRKQLIDGLKAGEALLNKPENDPAEMLAVLSGLLGVKITKLVRFRGGSNSYQMEVEGHTIDIPSIDLIDSQTSFRRILLDYTDKRITNMKSENWHEFINQLFSVVENVQVSSDATRKGAYENWLSIYLSDSVCNASDWERAACANEPFYKDGYTYFVAEGFRQFLYSRFQEKISSQQLTTELTKLGYQHERKSVKTRKGNWTKRSLWRAQ